MQPYFIWKGVDSRMMGLWVQQYPPIVRPPMRYQSITIPGRPGALTLLEGEDVYDPYTRELKLMPKPGADIYAIMRWLTGEGDVVFGHEPERRQHARIYDEVSFQREFAQQRSAVVRFLCDPFKTSIHDTEPINIDLSNVVGVGTVDSMTLNSQNSYTLVGRGDVIAYPKFELVGSGAVTLTVGTTQIALTLSGGDTTAEVVTLDCEARKAYRTVTEEMTSYIEPVTTHGDFCTLPHDKNTLLQWSEGLTELRVWPRWRWF